MVIGPRSPLWESQGQVQSRPGSRQPKQTVAAATTIKCFATLRSQLTSCSRKQIFICNCGRAAALFIASDVSNAIGKKKYKKRKQKNSNDDDDLRGCQSCGRQLKNCRQPGSGVWDLAGSSPAFIGIPVAHTPDGIRIDWRRLFFATRFVPFRFVRVFFEALLPVTEAPKPRRPDSLSSAFGNSFWKIQKVLSLYQWAVVPF